MGSSTLDFCQSPLTTARHCRRRFFDKGVSVLFFLLSLPPPATSSSSLTRHLHEEEIQNNQKQRFEIGKSRGKIWCGAPWIAVVLVAALSVVSLVRSSGEVFEWLAKLVKDEAIVKVCLKRWRRCRLKLGFWDLGKKMATTNSDRKDCWGKVADPV